MLAELNHPGKIISKNANSPISRHGIMRFSKESIGAAFGRAPQGRGAPLWLLSLLNLIKVLGHTRS